MAKAFPLKMRQRLAVKPEFKKHKPKTELEELKQIEETLEDVRGKVENLEQIEEEKQPNAKEFSWIKGSFSIITLQDFIGAIFGALFFVVTQEVWDIALKIKNLNLVFVFIISLFTGFSLVYFSRRRKSITHRLHLTAFLRTIEMYVISFIVSIIFIFIFNIVTEFNVYLIKTSVIVTLPAIISAATADLLFY